MSLNILVVDDSSVMRGIVVKTLRLCGVPLGEIHEAGNGQEGLEVLENNWIDLALIDINMPVMNGEEMIERVRANPETRDLQVIVVSTESSETRIEMLQKKDIGFVHKPFSPEVLRKTIAGMIGGLDGEQSEQSFTSVSGPDF
jgi:two-component system chemotaxis response regulator CheY